MLMARFKTRLIINTLLGLFLCISLTSLAQDQNIADSLLRVYQKRNLSTPEKLELLRNLAYNESNLEKGIQYAEQLIELAGQTENLIYSHRGHLQKGYKLWRLGEFDESLSSFIEALDAAIKAEYLSGQGNTYCAMADLYSSSSNHSNALIYYNKAISILKSTTDSVALATTLLNAGDTYLLLSRFDSALLYFQESGSLFNILHHQVGQAYTLGNTGMVYANLGDNELAEQNINEAISILEEMGDFYPVCFYLISMADIFQERGDIKEAIAYAQRSLDLAVQYELKQQISDANLKLSELHESQGNANLSLQHYKDHIAYRDSVINLKNVQQMADQRTEFEVSLREGEITTLEREKELQRTYIAIAFILLVLSGVIILYFRQRFYNTELMAKAERKEHEDEIHDLLKTQETKALQSMVKGKEEERRHLATELHNHLGSLLATVKVNLNGLDHQEGNKLETIIGLVDRATQDVRNLSHELHMGVSENFGLIPALQELVSHLQRSKQLHTKLSADLGAIHITSEDEILIYRIVQELVSNVLKHAKATILTISLTGFEEDNLISIMVEDNGKGFDPDKLQKTEKGIGLDSLEDMIHKLEGEIHIDSIPGRGTTINVDLSFVVPENHINS
jgi:signal transduction histidine kinase